MFGELPIGPMWLQLNRGISWICFRWFFVGLCPGKSPSFTAIRDDIFFDANPGDGHCHSPVSLPEAFGWYLVLPTSTPTKTYVIYGVFCSCRSKTSCFTVFWALRGFRLLSWHCQKTTRFTWVLGFRGRTPGTEKMTSWRCCNIVR